MEQTEATIRCLYPLSEQAFDHLVSVMKPVRFPKGGMLFQAGKVEREIYFLEEGIARAYQSCEKQDITFWFGTEGAVILPFESYLRGHPAYETVEVLEPSLTYAVRIDALERLFETDLELANWGRKLAENELVSAEKRYLSGQFRTASERYLDLIEQHPELLQRVPLGYIASYLGVTQVTLSRIRAGIR